MATDEDGRPIYKLRRSGTRSFSITVPSEIGLAIPPDTYLAVVAKDNGFTYEFVEGPPSLPDWMRAWDPVDN